MSNLDIREPTIRARISVEQKRALAEIARNRDVPIVQVVSGAIAAVTGVPDTLRRHGVRRKARTQPEEAHVRASS